MISMIKAMLFWDEDYMNKDLNFQLKSKWQIIVSWSFLYLFFILLTVFTLFGRTLYFDNLIMKMLSFPNTYFLKLFFVGISQLSLYMAIIFPPIIVFWYILRNNKRKGHFILVVMVGSVLIWEFFNILISWPRPQTSIALTQSYSYPSGHVLVGVCFYLSLAITISDSMDNRNKRIIAWAIPIIIIAMISVSRMYLRAHYPTDVIAGIVIGILWLLTVVIYFDKIEVLLNRIERTLGLDRINKYLNSIHYTDQTWD